MPFIQDFENMGAKKVAVVTDSNVVKFPAFQTALESLHKAKVNYEVYDKTRVEPTDERYYL